MILESGRSSQYLLASIADLIEADPVKYDQAVYVGECGAQHCVAGWACFLVYGQEIQNWTNEETWETARALLDFEEAEALNVFSLVPSRAVPNWLVLDNAERASAMAFYLRARIDLSAHEARQAMLGLPA